jgi:hypothetical protein
MKKNVFDIRYKFQVSSNMNVVVKTQLLKFEKYKSHL